MRMAQLGELASIVRGISFPKEDKRSEPLPGHVACLRTTNVQRSVEWDDLWFVPEGHVKREEQFVRTGDILISTANSYELVGKVAPVHGLPHKTTLGAFISLIRPNDSVDPMFLYHQLAWGKTQQRIRETASTTTNISNVSTKKLLALELFVPDLDEQRRIVAEIDKQFSRLDEAIANLQRVKANLKRYKAAVLKAAVEGRLTAGNVDSFRRARLGELVELNPRLPKGSLDENSSVTFVPMAAVGADDGRLDLTAIRTYSEVRKGYTYFTDNDVLFAKVTPCMENGKIAVAKGLLGGIGFGSTEFHVLRPKPDVDPRYVYCIVSSESFRKEAARHMTGAVGLRRVPTAFLESVEVSVPPLADQLSVVSEVERRLTIIQEVEAEVDINLLRSKSLRQAALSKAFSGKLV